MGVMMDNAPLPIDIILDAHQEKMHEELGIKNFITIHSEAVGVATRDRCCMPNEVARAMLRPERTLTARVAELEQRMAEHDRRIAALERKDNT
jgi:hypothetical protein